jgi:site-specific DNA-methyltransferase (adenine-specific)/site-specific DNA-methyltransferase (cytosine-N4-specific)
MEQIKVIHSDVYAGLKSLTNKSINVAITSPPYWKQRDYGFDGQIGSEERYQDYIGKLVTIFRVLRDKLTDEGIFFLNIGDKYLSKYGKSPLGLIPYKLAYFMEKDGWRLEDILIWYKPNHMPSSIKNRFSNTYEPIFVFSKSDDNYYRDSLSKNLIQSKVLKINVQPTPYKHMAVYPEKLVEALLSLLNLPYNSVVLDPFAGSGTTGKAVQNLNSRLEGKSFSCVMIEQSSEYVQIIKERCNVKEENIQSLKFVEYQATKINEESINIDSTDLPIYGLTEKGMVKIVSTKDEYYALIGTMLKPFFKRQIRPDALIFIGSKDFDIELIYKTSLLNNNGWVIRNMLMINDGKKVFPVFMIVDDNKKYKYLFNLDNIRIPHKSKDNINWKERSFIGYKVFDNLHKNRKSGIIINVIEDYPNGFPKWVSVKWNNGTISNEFVIYDDTSIPNIKFVCRVCGITLEHYFDPINILECPNCHTKLWEDTYPKIIEDESFVKEISVYNSFNSDINNINTLHLDMIAIKKKSERYNGKFKDANKINLGASPGARSSIQDEYFSVRRLYNVEQEMICNYLELKRKLKGLSKKEITEMFPKDYVYTVGHWFRKDFGGSIPTPEDWLLLRDILNLDDDFTNYVLRTGLKLQTVRASSNGKNPGDYLEIEENIEEILSNAFK